MFRKLISGALSLSLLVSAALSGNLNSLVTEQNRPSDDSVKNTDVSVEGQNSLGKYIENVTSDNASTGVQQLGNKASDYIFSIGSVEFDNETGKISIVSSQSLDCNILVSFVDEDNSDNKINVKIPVKKGQEVVSESLTDVTTLPEFYIIRAVLTDNSGRELSSNFTVYRFDRAIQEVINSDIHDYNEEYVVNLDESEETNFIVLSEDTIMAESSDQENTLVSADYDNEVFTFDNIDDSIRDLESGDNFFIRPSEDDIIMVNVKDIKIKGNEATLTGSGEVADMLDAVKFDTVSDLSDAKADPSTADPDVFFPDLDEETGEIDMSDKKLRFEYRPDILLFDIDKDYSANTKLSLEVEKHKDDGNLDDKGFLKKILINSLNYAIGDGNAFDTDSESCSFSFSGEMEIDNHTHLYKKHKEIEFSYQNIIQIETAINLKLNDREITRNFGELHCPIELEICDLFFNTPIPGIVINATPGISLNIEGSIKCSHTFKTFRGLYLHSNKDENGKRITILLPINAPFSNSESMPEFSLEGAISLGFFLDIKVSLFHPDIMSVGLKVTTGIEANATSGNIYEAAKHYRENVPTEDKVIVTDSNDPKQHICKVCIPCSIIFFIEANFEVTAFGEDVDTKNIASPRFELKLSDFFYSGTYGFGLGECPHYRYRTTLKFVNENDGSPISGADAAVNGVHQTTDNNGCAVFYCADGDYTYDLTIGDKWVALDSAYITIAGNGCSHTVSIPSDLNNVGELEYGIGNLTATSPVVTTVPVTTTTMPSPQLQPVDIDESRAIAGNGSVKVKGDDDPDTDDGQITFIVYNPGYSYINGYGMIDDYYIYSGESLANESPYKNWTGITDIVIENRDEANGKSITGIGQNFLAFNGNDTELESIEMPDTIAYFDDYAFTNRKGLKHIKITNKDNYLEESIQTGLNLPDNLERIGSYAFQNCEELFISDGNICKLPPVIGQEAFENCSNIDFSKLDFSKVTKIGSNAFLGVHDSTRNDAVLTNMCELDEGVYYFRFSDSTAKILVLNGYTLTDIKENWFKYSGDDSEIKRIEIPDSIVNIGNSAFWGQSELKDIILISEGDQNERIAQGGLNLPDTLESIGSFAFKDCKELYINDDTICKLPPVVRQEAFENCCKLDLSKFDLANVKKKDYE